MDRLAALESFCHIAELGSLGRAAAVLGTSSSLLSRQLGALETHLGGRLFHRTGRGLAPTELGRLLLPQARALVNDGETLVAIARGEQTSPSGTVDVGVMPGARPLIAEAVSRLRQQYPRIRLRAHEAFSGQVEAMVAQGQVDFGLFNRYGRGVVSGAERVMRSPVVLVGARGAPAVRQATLEIRSLAGVPLAIPLLPNAMVNALQAQAERARIKLDIALEGGSEAILQDAVAHAGLYTAVPRFVARRDYPAPRFQASILVGPQIRQTAWLAQSTQRPVTTAVRMVGAMIRVLAPRLAQGEES